MDIICASIATEVTLRGLKAALELSAKLQCNDYTILHLLGHQQLEVKFLAFYDLPSWKKPAQQVYSCRACTQLCELYVINVEFMLA